MSGLTERQRFLLRLISHGDCTIYGAQVNMETTLFAVSNMRNNLVSLGLIKKWKGYGDVMKLSARGRGLTLPPADRTPIESTGGSQ